jgi:hypothetical protein
VYLSSNYSQNPYAHAKHILSISELETRRVYLFSAWEQDAPRTHLSIISFEHNRREKDPLLTQKKPRHRPKAPRGIPKPNSSS